MVTAFTGAMNIANDTLAGERERGSLGTSADESGADRRSRARQVARDLRLQPLRACVLTLLISLAVLYATPLSARMHASALLWMLAVALPLVPFAAGFDLLICTFARTPKEGNSYLAVALLAPMLTGMLAEFFPVRLDTVIAAIPLLGQQRMLSAITRGEIPHFAWLAISGGCALLLGVGAMLTAARLLRDEKVVFGR